MTTSRIRTLFRATATGLLLALIGTGAAGWADTPSNWENSPDVSAFQFILVLFLIPIGLFVVITVLSSLPSLMKQTTSSAVVARDADEPKLDANQH